MRNEPTAYRAYLLRIWLNDQDGQGTRWHASLEEPHTGERLGFASLEQLFAYLLTVTEGKQDKGKDALE